MNKNTLVSLFGALLVATASAASSENESSIALPVFEVTATRGSSAEDHVNHSLSALRALANAPVHVSIDLPALKAPVNGTGALLARTRVAKL